jgi:hypothetical protein
MIPRRGKRVAAAVAVAGLGVLGAFACVFRQPLLEWWYLLEFENARDPLAAIESLGDFGSELSLIRLHRRGPTRALLKPVLGIATSSPCSPWLRGDSLFMRFRVSRSDMTTAFLILSSRKIRKDL